jgi:hypothetical protein
LGLLEKVAHYFGSNLGLPACALAFVSRTYGATRIQKCLRPARTAFAFVARQPPPRRTVRSSVPDSRPVAVTLVPPLEPIDKVVLADKVVIKVLSECSLDQIQRPQILESLRAGTGIHRKIISHIAVQ